MTDLQKSEAYDYAARVLAELKRSGAWETTHAGLLAACRQACKQKGEAFDERLHERALKDLLSSGLVARRWTILGRLYSLGEGRYA